MQPYYNTPVGPGMMGGGMGMMNPMAAQMQQQQQMGMMQPGMGMGGMIPQGMGMGGMMGNGMMGGSPLGMYGQAWKHLGYDYQLPEVGYTPQASWGAWDLANARYNGARLERSFFDNLIDTLGNFFSSRHLSEDTARNAHRRVYFGNEGADAGNKTLGGAAAYNAWLLWDRDHHSVYHQLPNMEQCHRLVGLAIAELYSIWDRIQPRSSRADINEAAQYAAATAKYLYERHYDLPSGGMGSLRSMMNGQGRYSGYNADDDSDSGSEGHRMRRRSGYGIGRMNGMGMGSIGPMGMPGGGMMPPAGMGMQAPGYGAAGMPGVMMNNMGHMGGMGMGMNGVGMSGYPMMGNQMGMGGMGMGGGMGMNPTMMQGGYGNPNNEAQAVPGMHPYQYGSQSGVAYGQQPIDQMGNPTFPGGPGRSWYAYGEPRPF